MSGYGAVPSISVVLPAYNAERFLGEAVKSILRQTFTDFELIAIDDGSTDRTREILAHYEAADRRLRVVSRENRGLVASLNEGISLARSQWVARMDADDIALSNRLELQMKQLDEQRGDICGGAVRCFGSRQTVWRYPTTHEACEVQLLFDAPFAHPSVIGKRELFMQLRYNPSFTNAEDYDLWQRAWQSGYRLTNAPEEVLLYRVHDEQISAAMKDSQKGLAQVIRRRHWEQLVGSENGEAIDAVLAALSNGKADLSVIAPILSSLSNRYSGEALDILEFNAFRIFCRLAACNPAPRKLWRSLPFAGDANGHLKQSIILSALNFFRLQPQSEIFARLRKRYLG